MSDHNKHIDRIFQEGFKDFETQPSDEVWKKIQTQIQPKRKRFLPFWLKTAGVAASLLLAFSLGYWLQPNPTNASTSVTNINEANDKIEIQTDFNTEFEKANQLLNQLIKQNALVTKDEIDIISSVTSSAEKVSKTQNNQLQSKEIASNEAASFDRFNVLLNEAQGESNQDISTLIHEAFQQNFNLNGNDSTANQLTSTEKTAEEKRQFDEFFDENEIAEKSAISNRWFIKPVLSPIFNAGNNASSALGPEVANNSSSGDVSFSYGMQVGFKLNNKWSIRTGINQVNTSYTTENVIYAPAASAFMPEGTNSAYGLFGQDYYTTSMNTQEARIFSQEGSLSQQMNFVEIPLEVEYALLEGKFGIRLTGGASTLFLTDNGLLMDTPDGRVDIGEAKNLNPTSFSTNVGLGLHYQLSRKIQFNVEPALRYQINTFQGSSLNFNPYFFGVYSGLQFQF